MAQITNPIEVIETRLILEPQLARLAALRASPTEIAQIVRAATTRSGEDYVEADIAFHQAVAAGSRNDLARELYRLLRDVGADTRQRLKFSVRRCPERLKQRDSEHRAVAMAIADRDPIAAEQTMLDHLTVVQEKIMNASKPKPARA